ncbi:MAG: F0F1 ATP synthase subunit epsilon [Burkholderiaceae bacterium]|jgi:F-type H+-transporting ATPase subunit epsilon|nr:F0F1 ATP synthase subunit epsilon [Burkholderiaceae bacterium]
MKLLLSVPTGIILDTRVTRVSAESDRGSFTLLPRHADGAMLLRPGLLSYTGEDGVEVFVAVDEGVLVKAGLDVRAACQRAVIAGDLQDARFALMRHLHERSEHERKTRSVLMALEADVLRRLGELR